MPIGIIPVLRPWAAPPSQASRSGFNAYRHYPCVATEPIVALANVPYIVSMPIGIIPVLRRATRGRRGPCSLVSMPLGIIPVLRPATPRRSRRALSNFNAYRHYPCVATHDTTSGQWRQYIVSMPIGIIPVLRPHPPLRHRRRRAAVSMPIGIIPVLRLTGPDHSARTLQ